MTETTIELGSHRVDLSSLDKVLFPQEGITKGNLIDYYRRIAESMLPHLEGRPISMQRFPDGIEGEGFYQKEAPDYFPDWIRRVSIEVKEDRREQQQVVCDNVETLVYLANQACLSLHGWLSRAEALDHPDRLVFDLDPPTEDFEPVRIAAQSLRDILQEVGLAPFVMTTGSKGLHVVVPLDGSAGFDSVRSFARDLAGELAQRSPEQLTTETRKNKRRGRLFLDYLRNAYAQTSVTPYSVRPLPGAPVAAPLDWSELADSSLDAQSYRLDNIFRRLGQKEDPWRKMADQACSLAEARRELESLLA